MYLYGECPQCGNLCQPDGDIHNGFVEEGCECPQCGLWFEYHYELEGSPEVYERKWNPIIWDRS